MAVLSDFVLVSTSNAVFAVAVEDISEAEDVTAAAFVEEVTEVVVANLIPQAFSASKVKSRFLAWHSSCCLSTDPTHMPLALLTREGPVTLTGQYESFTVLSHAAEISLAIFVLGAHASWVICA